MACVHSVSPVFVNAWTSFARLGEPEGALCFHGANKTFDVLVTRVLLTLKVEGDPPLHISNQ
jgi:hypothetical protein